MSNLLYMLVAALLSISSYFKDPPHAIVTATVYNAVPSQTDEDPLITATGFEINPNNPQKIIAVSRDLEDIIPLGSVVRIEGTDHDGIYRVEDRMHYRWTNKIDILVPDSINLGKWHAVQIWVID